MVQLIKVKSIIIIFLMDMVIKLGIMEIVLKDILYKEKEMVLEDFIKKVVMYIEVILKIIKWLDMVLWLWMMVKSIKVILLMVNLTVKVY